MPHAMLVGRWTNRQWGRKSDGDNKISPLEWQAQQTLGSNTFSPPPLVCDAHVRITSYFIHSIILTLLSSHPSLKKPIDKKEPFAQNLHRYICHICDIMQLHLLLLVMHTSGLHPTLSIPSFSHSYPPSSCPDCQTFYIHIHVPATLVDRVSSRLQGFCCLNFWIKKNHCYQLFK